MAEQPQRRICGTLHFGADSWDDVRAMLNALVHRTREGPIVSIVSGGWGSGYDIKCAENPEQTGDQYREQLETYMAEKKEAGDG